MSSSLIKPSGYEERQRERNADKGAEVATRVVKGASIGLAALLAANVLFGGNKTEDRTQEIISMRQNPEEIIDENKELAQKFMEKVGSREYVSFQENMAYVIQVGDSWRAIRAPLTEAGSQDIAWYDPITQDFMAGPSQMAVEAFTLSTLQEAHNDSATLTVGEVMIKDQKTAAVKATKPVNGLAVGVRGGYLAFTSDHSTREAAERALLKDGYQSMSAVQSDFEGEANA